MTDYKQLCAELLTGYEILLGDLKFDNRLAKRARAALAEPEPPRRCIYSPVQIAECGGPCEQGPEYCDCGELCVIEPAPEPKGPTQRQLMMLANDMGMASVGDAAEYARAVLARWGNHPGSPDRSGNLKAGLTRSPAAGEVADAGPVAWMYRGEPDFDGTAWRENWEVTTSHQLAVFKAQPNQPVPLVPAAQSSAGEVAELVAWLRRSTGCADESPMDLRAADLLERLSPPRLAAEPPSPEQGQVFKDADTGVIYVRDGDQWLATQPVPQPVSVAERLPGPGDCDAEGLCWVWNTTAYTWGLFRLDLTVHSHWLPAHALPLPS